MQPIYALCGRLVLRDRILEDGAVIIEDEKIAYAGKASAVSLPDDCRKTDGYIAPGFVDIHNHLSILEPTNIDLISQNAAYHFQNGTTGALFTLYRDVPHETLLQMFRSYDELQKRIPQLLGIHLEGPYINPKFGCSGSGKATHIPCPEQYTELIRFGYIKQWTFAPENEETDAFLDSIVKAGIAPAIGHSSAAPERVFEVCDKGVRIVTHLLNATGSSVERKGGVYPVSFDAACLLQDNLFYEIICDRNGVHIPHDLIRLVIKTVGTKRLVCITDFCGMPNSDLDVLYNNGELSGSCMTMRQVAQNLRLVGLGLPDIFRITAYNPACAINMQETLGSLDAGKTANLLLINEELTELSVIFHGKPVSQSA